jgi:hypothetical protein
MADEDLIVRIGLTEKQYLAALKRIEAQSVKAAKGADTAFAKQNRSFVRGATQANAAANGFARGGLRNIGMQLSQVAQQGAVTGDYFRAMSVQAADIGLAFGTIGIAVGAAITVLAPFAMELLRTGEAGEDLEEVFKGLAQAMSNLDTARSGASQGRFGLMDEYGALAVQAEKLFEIERRIAEQRAQTAIQSATAAVASELGAGAAIGLDPDKIRFAAAHIKAMEAEVTRLSAKTNLSDQAFLSVNRRIVAMRDEIGQIKSVSGNLDDLADSLGVSDDVAREVAARLAEISQLDAGRDQAEAFAQLSDYIWESSDGLSDASEEGKALYDKLRDAVLAALDLSKTDIATTIGAGADEAKRLADNFTLAATMARNMAGSAAAYDEKKFSEAFRNGMTTGKGVTLLDLEYDDFRPPSSGDNTFTTRETAAGRSGGGGGKSSALKQTEEYARLAEQYIEQTRTALEEYNAELALLEILNQRGFFSEHPEAYARAVEQVNTEFDREQFDAYREGVAGFTDALFEGGDALRDWARTAVIELAKIITQMMILKALGLPTGGVMAGGGFLGSLFAGFFDGGGNIPSGQFGIAGENGPEIIRGPAHVTSTADTARAMGGQAVDVRVIMDDDGKLSAIVEKRAMAAVSRAAPGIVRQSVSATYSAAREEPLG